MASIGPSPLPDYLRNHLDGMESIIHQDGASPPGAMDAIASDVNDVLAVIQSKGQDPAQLAKATGGLIADEKALADSFERKGDTKGAESLKHETDKVLGDIAYNGGQGAENEARFREAANNEASNLESGGTSDPSQYAPSSNSDPSSGQDRGHGPPGTLFG